MGEATGSSIFLLRESGKVTIGVSEGYECYHEGLWSSGLGPAGEVPGMVMNGYNHQWP